MSSPLALLLQKLSGTARIQKSLATDAWSAVTMMSYRWPIPMLTEVVVYGTIGTKSDAMTVKV